MVDTINVGFFAVHVQPPILNVDRRLFMSPTLNKMEMIGCYC